MTQVFVVFVWLSSFFFFFFFFLLPGRDSRSLWTTQGGSVFVFWVGGLGAGRDCACQFMIVLTESVEVTVEFPDIWRYVATFCWRLNSFDFRVFHINISMYSDTTFLWLDLCNELRICPMAFDQTVNICNIQCTVTNHIIMIQPSRLLEGHDLWPLTPHPHPTPPPTVRSRQ